MQGYAPSNINQSKPMFYQPTPGRVERFFFDETVEGGRFSVVIDLMPDQKFKVSCAEENHFSIFFNQLSTVTKGAASRGHHGKGTNFVILDRVSYWEDVAKVLNTNNLQAK